jgi:hypothetical protein
VEKIFHPRAKSANEQRPFTSHGNEICPTASPVLSVIHQLYRRRRYRRRRYRRLERRCRPRVTLHMLRVVAYQMSSHCH